VIFLWTITKYGKIWLDGEAFRQIVAKRLPADFFCQEVSFVGDQNLLNVYVALPDKDDPQTRLAIIDKFEKFFSPMGIAVHVHWTRKAPEELRDALPLWKKPLCWAAAGGGVAGLANLGLKGIAWVVGATVCSYIIGWLAVTEDGNKLIEKFVSDIKDFRR
jgi:hypothetical protein